MSRRRTWTDAQLRDAVAKHKSVRAVIAELGLVPAGGNYQQVQKSIDSLLIDTSHFTGKGWRKDRTFPFKPVLELEDILVKNSTYQSFKLKKRLFRAGLKQPACEICGWAKKTKSGRIPVELDHINGDRFDNRIENLRILCPNCHSLQSTHRGMNQKRRGGEIGRRATLKML